MNKKGYWVVRARISNSDNYSKYIELATNTASFAQQLKIEYEKELQRIVEQK